MSDLDEEEVQATREMKQINKIIALEEKSADEMFEKLGYTKELFGKSRIAYGFIDEDGFLLKNIWFNKVIKKVEIPSAISFNTQELQAINKKCEELGWI